MVIALALWGCAAPQPQPQTDLLLITLDTTRADALGAYGASPSPSPIIDQLAAGGIRVEEAMTVAPLTLPAHSSLLTGLYPDRTGVRDNMSARLDDARVTLAEELQEAGYATSAFVSAAVLDHAFGLVQGFDVYSDGVPSGHRRLGVPRRPAEQVVTDAIAWLDTVSPTKPLFAWVHFYDAHRPYAPPEAQAAQFPDDPYLASIAAIDVQIGRLLEHLHALGRHPLVVVVADHGEGRGEHREQTHGWYVYRSTMRVPLILAGPGVPEGRQLDGPVSMVDLMPTILELLGRDRPEDIDGRSFAQALRGAPAAFAGAIYGETWTPRLGFGFSELRVLQDSTYRYIDAPQPELYAWRADPREEHDLVAEILPEAIALRDALRERAETEAAWNTAQALPDPEAARMLEALGYVATAPLPSAGPLPDPKTQPDMVERYDVAMLDARTRSPVEGIEVLEGFLEEFPGAVPARLLLGRACLLAGEYERGLDALQPLIAVEHPQALLLSAQLQLASGRHSEGIAVLQMLKLRWPSWSPPYQVLAEDRRQRGDCAGALAEAQAGLTSAADTPGLLVVRGACRAEVGELSQAEDDLRRALVLDPDDDDVRFLLGTLLAKTGRVEQALPILLEQAKLTPDRPEAVAALGLAQYEFGQLDEAIETLSSIVHEEGAGAEAPLVLADAWLQTGGDLQQALVLLDLAQQRDTQNVQVHAVRARVLAKMGRIDEAHREAEHYKVQAQTSGP